MQPLAAIRTSLVCLLIGVGAATSSAGQTVYRCGPAGNQYSALPCDGGIPVDVGDRRSAEQISEARNGAAAQRRLALAMARERDSSERATRPPQAVAIGPSAAAAPSNEKAVKAKPASAKGRPTKTRPAARAADSDDFVAVVPGSGKPTKKKSQP